MNKPFFDTVRDRLPGLLLFCRPGAEGDCREEICHRAGVPPAGCQTLFEPGEGLVFFRPPGISADALHHRLPFRSLIFCRQWLVVTAAVEALSTEDLGRRLRETVETLPADFPPHVVFSDSERGRRLSAAARVLQQRLLADPAPAAAERKAGLGQVCLLDERRALAGYAVAGNASPFPAGIPRLKLPPGAPSRSALKLEEALWVLLDDAERSRLLKPGMRAVDLGAAPGGWSHALARRGLLVTAVDRARLAPQVATNDLIEHQRADGFTFRPPRPVEWLFCDIIDRPSRVSARVAEWLRRGWCRRALFNLKLPMKRRYLQVRLELERLYRAAAGRERLEVRCRQLYHDRQEVTCYAGLSGRSG